MSNVLSKEATMNNKDKQEAERKYLHKVYEETKAENKKLGKEVGELKKFIRRFISVSPKDLSVKTPEDYVKDLNEFLEDREALQMTVEVQEEKVGELKAENKQLKEFINSLMTEEQKDICNGEAMELGEPTLQTPKDWIDRIRMFLEERDELEEKKDYWESEHSDLWYGVFGALNDGGYCATSTGQLIGFIRDIIEELEAEKFHSKQLKDCSYEEYCEYVGENKLIKEFEDLKNEIGELKEEKEKFEKGYFTTLKKRNWDASERKKLREEIKKLKEQLKKV